MNQSRDTALVAWIHEDREIEQDQRELEQKSEEYESAVGPNGQNCYLVQGVCPSVRAMKIVTVDAH